MTAYSTSHSPNETDANIFDEKYLIRNKVFSPDLNIYVSVHFFSERVCCSGGGVCESLSLSQEARALVKLVVAQSFPIKRININKIVICIAIADRL